MHYRETIMATRRSVHTLATVHIMGLLIAFTCVPITAKPLAIRAGKIVPVASPVINDGTIGIDGGKIVALGRSADVELPDDCEVLDVGGRWVMPGMIDGHIHIGTEGGFNDMVQPLNPELRIWDCLDPESPAIRHALHAGVTTIHTLPGSGTNHAGFGVITKTFGESAEDMIVRRVGTMKVAQGFNPERRSGELGLGWMGMSWMLRQLMRQARMYHEQWKRYEAGQGPRPRRQPELDQLRAAFRGECPVFVHTYRPWGVLMAARMFNAELGLKTIATHTEGGGYRVASEMAKRPGVAVDIGPPTAEFYAARDRRIIGHGAAYDAAGVRNLSINTDAVGYGREDQLYVHASAAARLGLDDAKALAAVTLKPARALGIDDRVGSLEVGKDADLVVKAGSLLDVSIPVDLVMVEGEIAYRRED